MAKDGGRSRSKRMKGHEKRREAYMNDREGDDGENDNRKQK